MRERITFAHIPGKSFDPGDIRVGKDQVEVKDLKAAREDKITFAYDELPGDLKSILDQCHEIHIRWVSPTRYESVSPFNSRLSPGLHVNYTPREGTSTSKICPTLVKAFGQNINNCKSPGVSFTKQPLLSQRFASSASLNFYHYIKWPTRFLAWATTTACQRGDQECVIKVNGIAGAEFLDIDYDTVSRSLVIKVFRQIGGRRRPWNEIMKPFRGSRLEVGVLSREKPSEMDFESIKLSGFLAVVGEDSKPNPTLFEFPSRHHQSPDTSASSYHAHFLKPQGLHPTLQLTIDPLNAPPAEGCRLHSYLTLPVAVFVDKYQYESPLFRTSNNLGPIRALSGATDLEAPAWAVPEWGSLMLIELSPPPTTVNERWSVNLPLHLRYLPPTRNGQRQMHVPWPTVFWACHAEEGTKMNTNPFDRVDSGYEGLFGPKTFFYHLSPNETATDGLVEILHVPVIDDDFGPITGPGTFIAIVAGVLWVLWKILLVVRQPTRNKSKVS